MNNDVKQTAQEPITVIDVPIYLPYHFTAGRASTRFLMNIKKGRIIGQRCTGEEAVYVPSRGACPVLGKPTEEEVEVSDRGIVRSFTIVHIPIPNNPIKPPFIVANILLDGASLPFIHLISEANNEDVLIGTPVQAVWKDEKDWDYSLENIKYFKPTGEPPIDIDQLLEEHRA